MSSGRSPNLAHRRLTNALRRLREDSGLTREYVAEQLDCSASTIVRYETARWTRIKTGDLRDLLDIYGVTDRQQRDAYVQLLKQAKEPGWWTQYSDVIDSYVGFEDDASSIHTFEPLFIPGLLQTEDYARALFQSNPTMEPEQIERRVEVRMDRQKLLQGRDAPELWAIVDETAIRRPVGGSEVMRAQLRHVLEASTAQKITFQVVPMSVGAHPGMNGSFVVLDFPDPTDTPVAYQETATDGLFPEGTGVVHRYQQMFDHLMATALSVAESRRLTERAASEL